jgi:hypothetical protein
MMSHVDDEMVGGERLGAHLAPVKAHAAGRVCAADGCSTILSVYNGGERCAVHDFRHGVLRVPHRLSQTPSTRCSSTGHAA